MRRRTTQMMLAASLGPLTVPLAASSTPAAAAAVTSSAVTAVAVPAAADATVQQALPARPAGTSTTLATLGRPAIRSYVTFAVPPAPPGQVLIEAALRVRTTAASSAGTTDDQVIRVAERDWDERTVTWANRPSAAGTVLGNLPDATDPATAYLAPLDPDVVTRALGQPLGVALLGTGTDNLALASRESRDWRHRPALVLRFAPEEDVFPEEPIPEPDPAPDPPVPTAAAPAPAVPPASAAPAAPPPAAPPPAAPPVAPPAAADPPPPAPAAPAADPPPAAPAADPPPAAPADPAPAASTPTAATAPAAPAATAEPAPAVPAAPAPAPTTAAANTGGSVTVLAVGDIACRPGFVGPVNACKHPQVASVVNSANPDWFVPLGDIQYDTASWAELTGPGGYDSVFGSLRPRTLPVLGNHEYLDASGPANGYWDYFTQGVEPGTFGNRGEGWYTRRLGSWRLIVLNSECAPDAANGNIFLPSGCGQGSPQYTWLEKTLTDNRERCTLVAFHRPRWTTGAHQPYGAFAPIWDLMARNGVDVTMSGHNHSTEVFRRIGVSGSGATPTMAENGIRSFVAGSGGRDQRPFPNPVSPALEARDSTTFGPLRLVLNEGSFDWDLMPIPGQTFTGDGTPSTFSGKGEACR